MLSTARAGVNLVGLGLLLSGVLLTAAPGGAGVLDASWTAPSTNADGSPVTDLASYRVYYGPSDPPCPGSSFSQVASPTSSPAPNQPVTTRLAGLATGALYYVSVTAVNTSGNESDCSTPVPSAVAQMEFAASPTGTVNFGSVNPGSFVDQAFTVQSTRGGTVSGTVSTSAPFSIVSGSPFTLSGAGATQTVTVRFRPTAAATATANLNFTANGDTLSRLLTGSGSAADTTPPTVTIFWPTSNPTYSTNSALLTLVGMASDNVRVTQITWTNSRGGSGTLIGTTTWIANRIELQPGTNVLTVTALDAAGNTATASLTVAMSDAARDTTPPNVAITSLAPGARVAGTVRVEAAATDNVGVVGVQFKLDNADLGTETTTSPHSVSWDTTAAADGVHTLTAVARDAAGNVATASAVTVTVDNRGPSISAVAPSDVTACAATITWTTDEAADSRVEYGFTTDYGLSTRRDQVQVTSHSMTLSGLLPGTLYHYRVRSRDAAGKRTVSPDYTFTTLAPSPSPYQGAAFAVPGIIEAEAFDNGGVCVAYHDAVPGNAGGQYRLDTDVDIIAGGTGYVVNNFEAGEWLAYTINVAQSGLYQIEALLSSQFTTSRWHAEVDGVDVTDSVAVPSTGSWRTFEWVGIDGVFLTAGQHVLRIHADRAYFNLDAIRIVEDTGAP